MWLVDVTEPAGSRDLAADLGAAVDECPGGTIQLWLHHVDPVSHHSAILAGFVPYRDLWQLRRLLPAASSELATRGIVDDDIAELISVNNRAFHWHPEQGGMTEASLRATMSEPWFDPEGLRLLHLDDRLAGFCWTKIHSDTIPKLGEIYVIALDPDFHGRSLGGPMTLAGLEWLCGQGIYDGMLYVESDNAPANAVYARLGFTQHHTDRAYRLTRT